MLLLAELHYFPVILIHKYSQHLSDRQTERERVFYVTIRAVDKSVVWAADKWNKNVEDAWKW